MKYWKCLIMHNWNKWTAMIEVVDDRWGISYHQRRECQRCGRIEVRRFGR